MGKALGIEDVIKKHEAIMDKADPKKQVALLVDEWGTWWDEEPGTIKGTSISRTVCAMPSLLHSR